MKLIRYGPPGQELPGILLPEKVRKSCAHMVRDWDRATLASPNFRATLDRLSANSADLPDVDPTQRWGPPVARPGKVLCIGLNYRAHAAESGMALPTEPILFMKAPNAVVGAFDALQIPRGSQKTDWEIELAVVIGSECRYLASPEEASSKILGYCIGHDVSEREFQLEHGGQWSKGKSCDTFCPLGPFIATPDEIPTAQQLAMQLTVNGKVMQSGNTSDMLFPVAFLIHYLSQFMTLEPGDVLLTGTPPGVGLGRKPQVYLKTGDVVELDIEGLGRQRQVCIDASLPECTL